MPAHFIATSPFVCDDGGVRPPVDLDRFHRRARHPRGAPWLQTLLLTTLMPVISLLTRFRVTGREHIPDGGYLVVANHRSNLDPLFVAIAIRRRVRFIGKADLFHTRWGGLFSRLGGFPVRRGVWDVETFETAIDVLGRGRVVAVFPEGGIVGLNDRYVAGTAKSGPGHIARRSGVPILPVHLEGTRGAARPWRLLTRVRVRIGAPLPGIRAAEATREAELTIAQAALDAVYSLAEDDPDR